MKIFSPILKGTTTVAQGTTNLSGSFTGSLFGTAATASYADNFTVGGTLTAQTINVQIITSSIEFNTGSTRNGALSTNTHQFTGSVFMSSSLGIGTSSPEGVLTIKGTSAQPPTSGTTANSLLQLVGSLGAELNIGSNTVTGGYGSYIQASDNNLAVSYPLNLQPNGGNVGIGTSSPSDLLEIKSTSANQGNIRIYNTYNAGASSNGLVWYRDYDAVSNTIGGYIYYARTGGSAGDMTFGTGTNSAVSERMRILSAGNVLIGRTTLTGGTGTFEVEQNNAGGYTVVVNSTNTIEPSIYFRSVGSATKSIINSNVEMSFRILGTERMIINSLGFTKANTAGSYRSGASLEGHEFSDNSANSFNHFTIYASSTSTQGTLLRVVSDRNTTNNTYNLIDAGGPSVDFIVRDSSNCVNTNGSYGAISDIRLKENIVDTSPKLEDLLKVKVRNYNLKSNPDLKQIGVIAQELEDIFPGMIEEALDDKTNEITKSVKYSVFVPMLIKAVQELSAENDTLKEILQRNNIQ